MTAYNETIDNNWVNEYRDPPPGCAWVLLAVALAILTAILRSI